MDNAQKFLKGKKAARAKLLDARKAFLVARDACTAAMKAYNVFVIPRAKRKKGRRG